MAEVKHLWLNIRVNPNQTPDTSENQTAPPSQEIDYSFINSAPQVPSSPLWTNGKLNIKAFAIIGGIGILVLLIIVFVLSSMFGSKGNSESAALTAIVNQQQKIILSATASTQNAQLQATRNLATSIQFTVTGDQQQLVALLAKNNIKIKDLQKLKDDQTTTTLSKASDSGVYDTVYLSIVDGQLTEYQKMMKTEYGKTKSEAVKKLLKSAFDNTTTLITQTEAAKKNPSL